MSAAKIARPARTHSIAIWTLRDGSEEFRVLHGQKIVSRHKTEADAMAAYRHIVSPQAD